MILHFYIPFFLCLPPVFPFFLRFLSPSLPVFLVHRRCVHPRCVHQFNFFSVSAFLSTRRGPCRSEAPSTTRAAPGDHLLAEPGGGPWVNCAFESKCHVVVLWVDVSSRHLFFSHVFPPQMTSADYSCPPSYIYFGYNPSFRY